MLNLYFTPSWLSIDLESGIIPVSLNYFLNNIVNNVPNIFTLYPAFPNPFNPVATISYDLSKEEFVQIKIYDLSGNEIRSLINSKQRLGYRSTIWDATNNKGRQVS